MMLVWNEPKTSLGITEKLMLHFNDYNGFMNETRFSYHFDDHSKCNSLRSTNATWTSSFMVIYWTINRKMPDLDLTQRCTINM